MRHFKPIDYMKIDIANSFGLDKEVWDKRIEWVNKNHDLLMDLIDDADEPAEYMAKVISLYEVEAGKPTNSCCGLDATSSGTQLLSCLTRDRKGATLCNVLPRIVDGEVQRSDTYKIINDFLGGGFEKAKTKKAVMTSFYGSRSKPKELFGDKVNLFYHTMEMNAPLAWALNEYILNECWDSNATMYSWTMPDNFHAVMENYKMVEEEVVFNNTSLTIEKKEVGATESGRSLGANLTHSLDSLALREIVYYASLSMNQREKIQNLMKGNYDLEIGSEANRTIVETLLERYKETNFLSARILHYIDAGNFHLIPREPLEELMKYLPKRPFEVIGIHDNFKCHPNYVEDVRKLYTYYLAKLCRSTFLDHWFKCIGKEDYDFQVGEEFYDEIINNSEYALA